MCVISKKKRSLVEGIGHRARKFGAYLKNIECSCFARRACVCESTSMLSDYVAMLNCILLPSKLPEELPSAYRVSRVLFIAKGTDTRLPCLLSQAPLWKTHLEFSPLSVKCHSCGVYICLWSHFVWDCLIVPHAGSVYSSTRHLYLFDAVFLIRL